MLGMLVTNMRVLIGDIRAGGCLRYSDHMMAEFTTF